MTTEYKTLRVPAEEYKTARKSKEDSETWGEFLRRCSENPPTSKEFIDADELEQLLTDEDYERIAEAISERLR